MCLPLVTKYQPALRFDRFILFRVSKHLACTAILLGSTCGTTLPKIICTADSAASSWVTLAKVPVWLLLGRGANYTGHSALFGCQENQDKPASLSFSCCGLNTICPWQHAPLVTICQHTATHMCVHGHDLTADLQTRSMNLLCLAPSYYLN